MAKFKVLMADSIFADQEIERKIFSEVGADMILAESKDPAVLSKLAEDCDAILVTYAEIGKQIIDRCTKCKVIVRTGIGYNNVDVEAATKKGIMVANVLNYCISEVADHAMALMLGCLRKTVVYNKSVHTGRWDMNIGRPIPRINTITLGLYGFGNIARQVAGRAKAFDMRVIAFDPYLPDEVFADHGVERMTDIGAFVSSCDILSLHLLLNKETKGIIDKKVFDLMKPTAYLINVSRGGLVKESDLIDAVDRGKIAGCGIDVMESEPGDVHSRLMTYDNVIVTPHAAFYSDGSDIELRQKACRQVVLTFTQGYPEFWVNKKEMERGEQKI